MKTCHYLILAHPRCGTGYMAKLFFANGIRIGHEKVKRDGTSNWQMAVQSPEYPFPGDKYRRQDLRVGQIIHLLRDPLPAVASIAYTERRSEYFRAQYVNLLGNEFEKAILSLSGWNKIIRAQMPTYTIALPHAVRVMSFATDVPPANTREHPTLTELQLQSLVSNDIWNIYLQEKEIYTSYMQL
jgi:hypothetical protein